MRVRGLVWRGIAWGAAVALLFSVLLVGMIGTGADFSPASPGSLEWFRARLSGVQLVAIVGTVLGALLGLMVGPFVTEAADRAAAVVDEDGRASVKRLARSCGLVAAGVTGAVLLLVMLWLGVTNARPLAHLDWAPTAACLSAVAGLLAAYEAPRAAGRRGVLLNASPTNGWLLAAALIVLLMALLTLEITVLPLT